MTRKGFTLIELMIVVAIIAIIAAIAIPSLLTAKKSGHEASVIASLRTLSSVQEQYRSRFSTYGSLANLSAASYIDSVLGSGNKNGYTFVMTAAVDTWACTAVPTTIGTTGDRGFRIDNSGVIRFSADGSAPTASASPLNE